MKVLKGAIIATSIGFTAMCGVTFAQMNPALSAGRIAQGIAGYYGYGVTLPTVTTLPATNISAKGDVILNGRLNTIGSLTSVVVGFNYAPVGGTGTIVRVPLARTTVGTFTNPYTITGLPCGTTYNVTAFALAGTAMIYGANVPFTTPACIVRTTLAPTVVTNPATGISRTGVTLNGSLTSLGGASSATVGFRYGTTTTYGTVTMVVAPRTSAGSFSNPTTISTLRPATIYHYQTIATNSAGTTYGPDMTFTTRP